MTSILDEAVRESIVGILRLHGVADPTGAVDAIETELAPSMDIRRHARVDEGLLRQSFREGFLRSREVQRYIPYAIAFWKASPSYKAHRRRTAVAPDANQADAAERYARYNF